MRCCSVFKSAIVGDDCRFQLRRDPGTRYRQGVRASQAVSWACGRHARVIGRLNTSSHAMRIFGGSLCEAVDMKRFLIIGSGSATGMPTGPHLQRSFREAIRALSTGAMALDARLQAEFRIGQIGDARNQRGECGLMRRSRPFRSGDCQSWSAREDVEDVSSIAQNRWRCSERRASASFR